MRTWVAVILSMALAGQAQAGVSKHDAKAAREAFKQGLKLAQQHEDEEAYLKFQEAAQLDPENTDFTNARELMRRKLVTDHLQQGNAAILGTGVGEGTPEDRRVKAMAEYRAALDLDPNNDYAAARLRDLLYEVPQQQPSLEKFEPSRDVRLRPSPQLKDIHFRGDSRALLTQIANLYGLTPVFDESFAPVAVSFELRQASFEEAIEMAAPRAKAIWTALSSKEIFFVNDTPDNRTQYERLFEQTFYLHEGSKPEALTELTNLLRVIYNIHFIVADTGQSTITLRAPRVTMEAVSAFLKSMGLARPQVMLDIHVYNVNQSLMHSLGVTVPTQFQMINVSSALLSSLGQNIQQQIQQIIQNGGLTPENQQAINALLAQLQAQQNSEISQLLNQPFILFGGGATHFAVVIPPIKINLSFNSSSVISLEHVMLRTSHGDTASMHIGERFPIQNAVYSPISTSPLLSLPGAQVSTFPSFSYEDLGIMLKAKPLIHMHLVPNSQAGEGPHSALREEAEVTLDLDLSIRALAGQSLNNVPVISNQQYTGTVRLKDGDAAIIAGSISRDQQRSLSGLPFFSKIFGPLTSNTSHNNTVDEVLVVVTPHIVRAPDQMENTEQWLPPGTP